MFLAAVLNFEYGILKYYTLLVVCNVKSISRFHSNSFRPRLSESDFWRLLWKNVPGRKEPPSVTKGLPICRIQQLLATEGRTEKPNNLSEEAGTTRSRILSRVRIYSIFLAN